MKEIPLTDGKVILVDDEDYDHLKTMTWSCGNGYARSTKYNKETRKTKFFYMHRYLMKKPEGLVVDHINGNKLDNRKENLRLLPIKFNVRNQRISKNNTSGYLGVTKHKNKWLAQIMVDREHKHLGIYDTPEEASKAYQSYVKKLWEDAGYEYRPLRGVNK